MRRSPDLTPAMVDVVVRVIRRMPGPVTWEAIRQAVGTETNHAYTRQALARKQAICAAYEKRARGAPARPGARRLSTAARERLERERRLRVRLEAHARLEVEWIDRWARWLYNARRLSVDIAALDRPLPPNDRKRAVMPP